MYNMGIAFNNSLEAYVHLQFTTCVASKCTSIIIEAAASPESYEYCPIIKRSCSLLLVFL